MCRVCRHWLCNKSASYINLNRKLNLRRWSRRWPHYNKLLSTSARKAALLTGIYLAERIQCLLIADCRVPSAHKYQNGTAVVNCWWKSVSPVRVSHRTFVWPFPLSCFILNDSYGVWITRLTSYILLHVRSVRLSKKVKVYMKVSRSWATYSKERKI